MHPALDGFLTQVWNGRTNIPPDAKEAAKYIYKTWYAVSPSASNAPKDFDKDIKEMVASSPGVTLHVQGHNEFFHVNPSDWRHDESIKKMRFRVYLNPPVAEALKVFTSVVRQFVVKSARADLKRPIKAKVAGANSLGRRDSIVVYTPDEQTAKTIAGATRGQFGANTDTPAMTVPAGPSSGVSIGAEPPAVTIFRDLHHDAGKNVQSFGNIRCEIIAAAFKETLAQGNPTSARFKELATDYLTVAGIDPDNPGLQTNKDNLETTWKLALTAKQRRK